MKGRTAPAGDHRCPAHSKWSRDGRGGGRIEAIRWGREREGGPTNERRNKRGGRGGGRGRRQPSGQENINIGRRGRSYVKSSSI